MARRGLYVPVILALTATLAAAARAEPPVGRVSGSGAVESSVGFSSFHISASITEGGQARGRARFDDVPVAGGRLTVDVTCLRVGTDVSSDGTTRRFAVITGPVVEAENGVGIGRQAIIGVLDGDQATPIPTADAIDADFALDLPPTVTCENAGLVVEGSVLRGSVMIR